MPGGFGLITMKRRAPVSNHSIRLDDPLTTASQASSAYFDSSSISASDPARTSEFLACVEAACTCASLGFVAT